MRGMKPAKTVDAYLANIPPEGARLLRNLRKQILAAAPGAEGVISYGMPIFKFEGMHLVGMAAAKSHCALYPMSLTPRVDLATEGAPYFSGMGNLRFTAERPLPASLVSKVVKLRIRENRETGGPYSAKARAQYRDQKAAQSEASRKPRKHAVPAKRAGARRP